MRIYVVSEETAAAIEKSAADEGKGGWQNLCAKIRDSECTDLRELRLAGVRASIENLQALLAAMEDGD